MKVNDALSQHTQTGVMPSTVGKLSSSDFMKYVDETRSQPAFRASMDKAADYYDGNQLTPEVLQTLEKMGFSNLMTNLIKPAIDAVLGIEAKMRQDFRVRADDEQSQEVAEALSAKLAEAERESRADRACSDAYASQVKTGLGWVHVARNSDPFLYKYKADAVHRREMFWDWSTPVSDPGLDTSRYLIRNKWFPLDQVVAAMPQHERLLRASGSGWSADWIQQAREDTYLANAYDQESRVSVTAWDWRNIDNRRLALQECWYATYVRGLVLDLGDRVVEFDKRNPIHVAAVGSGQFRPQPAVYRKLRASIWFGPHLLVDYDPGTNKFPYVPFWGFREDLTGVPYGLIRSMIPLQDEVNARRRKLMWLLSSKRVVMDSDAIDRRYNDEQAIVEEVSRPDSMIITNPARQRDNALRVESDLQLSQQQFEVLTEAKQGIQDAAGIFNSVMGKRDGGANSGVAINSLVEQSSNTMGEINDNFRFARQLVGERLLELIRQDLSGRPVQVMAGPNEARRKVISLNTPKVDPLTGITVRENDVEKAAVKVALEDIPSTPAYRAQQMMMLAETIKALPPAAQAALVPYYIEAGDLPKRYEMANQVRKAMGMPVEGEEQDPQVMQLQQQLQALQQQSEQAMQQYELAVREQSQKAEQLAQQVAGLQLQLRDKGEELALRREELARAAQETEGQRLEKVRKLELQQLQEKVKMAELALEQARLEHEKAKTAGELELRSTELEQNQLMAAQQALRDAEARQQAQAQPAEPEDDPTEAIEDAIEEAVKPLAEKVDMLIDAIQNQPQPAPAASAPGADPVNPQAPAKPKKRTVKVIRDEDGRMVGAELEDQ